MGEIPPTEQREERRADTATPAEKLYPVQPEFVREVLEALDDGDEAGVRALIGPLHAADVADLLELISERQRKSLLAILRDDLDPAILSELEEAVRDDIIEQLEPRDIAAAITELDSDDAVYVLEDLEEHERQAVLDKIPAQERAAVEVGLGYPEDSAGRLMQRDLIAVPPYWTVGQAIHHLREAEDLPTGFYEIVVVDPGLHPVGTIPLDRIMRAKPSVTIADIMNKEQTLIPVDMDQEEVSYLFKQYRLISAAVVDGESRLVGMITVDDVVDVIDEEAEEDLMLLGGVQEGDINEPAMVTTRTRLQWLLVNLATAILASIVISFFDASIEKLVALAILMPIVASMGGNAGTQTLTVTVRALATHELTATNATRAVAKEVFVGGINGILLALLIGVIAGLWFQDAALGLVLAAAMVINMLVAGLAGILIPLGLERLDIDPAVASSVFVTTITDVVGFLAFLGLAAVFLI
ncbi:MAG: magnesium transporter [Sphingomonadales bacterium]